MARESTRVEESATSPELTKVPSATDGYDGCESLGQEDGAQGALSRPEWLRGCEQTKESPLRYVGEIALT